MASASTPPPARGRAGLLRLRTVNSVTYAPPEWICKYGYHYGPCTHVCGE
ncbi:hypothetical protein [Nannocystis bainbridge]|uniref:Uncharacterized protein n=1 Tax=Nannocystis bainbridge TaxID=2995303 RepID=A0ABT5E431_9BACT|nr:hypothetical protein [Nannocystis bainbridge]MDC0720627.1 hypothetical protein [Nannocystis bainbridge]